MAKTINELIEQKALSKLRSKIHGKCQRFSQELSFARDTLIVLPASIATEQGVSVGYLIGEIETALVKKLGPGYVERESKALLDAFDRLQAEWEKATSGVESD